MPIYRMLEKSSFTPEQIKRMCMAYEAALSELKLRDRDDPLTLLIARAIIEVAQTGEREPMSICTLALERLDSAADVSSAQR